ncbi:type II toxin-antitoxin system prevent-host-death family antitoxin [Inquilinus limosus]|uniref:type II toxin-antitoxin system Phd/YefM family antitoxin n=1 Tax=Inquilinus limosus TaxID=171674 RepID=UPI003F13CC3E
MDRTVSAAEANRNFSRLLRDVREGRSYVVTAHGKPVARIVPTSGPSAVTAGARAALLTRLAAQPPADIGRWSRDELYERDR